MTNAMAFVLIEVSAGNVLKVFRELSATEGVLSCYAITGQYDLIAQLQADDMNKLGKISLNRIQRIPGVLRTITCNVIDILE